ncbi:hypothetical protein CFIMG_006233RA [Ceratocystis fimbriata CBS 114723]|uniref:Uncharacterized protein n=1 Tax=Ceratocystis fimbriata CBS 114723 TaxID=1035309 RepID=A0A2C5WVD8_9PEZI|nr:hypothetical protein CFIMG_006233RA [Ceratocystis fimbriata CBS 114723]
MRGINQSFLMTSSTSPSGSSAGKGWLGRGIKGPVYIIHYGSQTGRNRCIVLPYKHKEDRSSGEIQRKVVVDYYPSATRIAPWLFMMPDEELAFIVI